MDIITGTLNINWYFGVDTILRGHKRGQGGGIFTYNTFLHIDGEPGIWAAPTANIYI